MKALKNRKTFEEGDNVIVKGVDRKGTVNKRKGDFYNVTLDATEEQEKNNVFAGDMVKASRQISSMAIKQIENYYKQGILSKKEVIAVLMKENGWDYPEAKQIADYYERVFANSIQSSQQINSNAYHEGYRAFGWKNAKNPYPDYTMDYENWQNGYEAAKRDSMKNKVHSSRQIKSDYWVGDPIKEIDRHGKYSLYEYDTGYILAFTGVGLGFGNYFETSKDNPNLENVLKEWNEKYGVSVKGKTTREYKDGLLNSSKKSIQSRYYMDNSRQFTLSEIAQYLASLFFDLRTIHFNTTGPEFYTYHELAQELYEQTEDYYDDIVETAISFDNDVSPMYVLPGDWQFVDEHGSFDTNGQVVQTLILQRLQIIYDVLENVDEYDSMVQSKIDSMMEFYDKEIYKLKQAMR